MTSPHRNQILRQIRDGKRVWSYAEIGDLELFRRNVVMPLRELNHDGMVPALSEIESLIDGRLQIIRVEIIGKTNGVLSGGDDAD